MEIQKNPLTYIILGVVILLAIGIVYFQLNAPDKEIGDAEEELETCGEGTVIYQDDQLCWQRSVNPSKVNSWQEANSYCENLDLGGRDDWRLPIADELKSLVDSSYEPSINPKYFLGTETTHYWTSSLYRTDIHWYIHFELGYQGFAPDITNNFGVRCVRDSTLL